jgi:hypothetical protein
LLYYLPGPTIARGESLSNAVDCGGHQILRIITPDAWDAAPLTFQLSPDSTKFNDLYQIQATTSAFVPWETAVPVVPIGASLAMPSDTGSRIFWLRFRSGSRSLPVPQQADRVFSLVLWVADAATWQRVKEPKPHEKRHA